jgi:hypothetical protein
MMAMTIEAFMVGNPRRSFWHFRTLDFDSVSYIGIIMVRIIQLSYFGDENFTLMDAEKLLPKAFFNESSGPAFVGASSKFNFVSCWVICDVQALDPPINTEIMHLLEDWLLSLMSTLVIGFGPQD